MRYTVSKSIVEVIGSMWMGGTAAKRLELSAYDLDNATNNEGKIDRDSLERWLCLHEGDFSGIDDFSADLEFEGENIVIEWEHEDSEFVYTDCMYGDFE